MQEATMQEATMQEATFRNASKERTLQYNLHYHEMWRLDISLLPYLLQFSFRGGHGGMESTWRKLTELARIVFFSTEAALNGSTKI